MTEDLVTFLRARLDEDAAIAAEATQETTGRWTARETDWGGGPFVEDDCGALILPTPASRVATHYQHIVRHNPSRVLAEVEAKRRIIEEYERYAAERRRAMGGWDTYSEVSPILAALAAVYADHPDYREEWRP